MRSSSPRRIDVSFEKRPIIIFTDGCWEAGFAGIGAAIVDTASGERVVCSGVVPPALLDSWKGLHGDHLICQIELFVMVQLRWQYRDWFLNRRTIWWVDNDAARYCTIKGLSPSVSMRALVRAFYQMDSSYPTYSWIERVPSKSNVSDGPSRRDNQEALSLLGLDQATMFETPEELLALLV